MDKTIYDISQYDDQELYRMLDLDHPTDRELEMKIIVLLQKYQDMDNPMGRQMYLFFNDIYHHFFEDDEAEVEAEAEAVVEGFENPTTTPPVIQTSGNWTGAELDVLPDSEVSRGTAITVGPSQKAGVASENTVKVGINTNYGSSLQNTQIGYQKSLDYTKGTLNPIIKETIQRIISIDSQFRDVNVYPYSTDFAFNLSDTLQDVVSLKLYSVQIPFTWYTVSNAYGSNFIYIKGNSAGIKDTEYDISINIPSGNYQSADLVLALNSALNRSIVAFPDIIFGPTTNISYNPVNSRATITLDMQQIYNESYYYVDFPKYDPPQVPQLYIKFINTPYMKFQCVNNYYIQATNDISLVVPPPNQDSSNNSYVSTYGYSVSSFLNTVTTIFHNSPYTNIHNSLFDFHSSTISTTPISNTVNLDYKFQYRIPAYYSDGLNRMANFKYKFVSYDSNNYNNNHMIPYVSTSWNNLFYSVDNFAVDSSNTTTFSSDINLNINIGSIYNPSLKLLSSPAPDGSLNLLNRLKNSWYDTNHNWFVDQSDTSYVIPDDTYFYDIHTLVIQIQSIGPDNQNVPMINIPVILDGSGFNTSDPTSGIALSPTDFTSLLNQTMTNNAKRLAENYRIYINPTPFTFSSPKIIFDTSISEILTEQDYQVSFYDTNGYPENTTNQWGNLQNMWYNYLKIPNPSYVLSNTNPIMGNGPFVDPSYSLTTNKIFPTLDQYSLQSFLGYKSFLGHEDVSYNIAILTSNTFLGSKYNSYLHFPTIQISNTFLNGSTSVFDIHLYQSTVVNLNDPSLNTTTNYSDMMDSSYSIPITYRDLSGAIPPFTIQQIIQSINTSLQSYGIFTSKSRIDIIDMSGATITNDSLNDTGNYYYQLTIQFDRKKVRPAKNMKTMIQINDVNTWSSYFNFNIPITDANNNRIELSEIVSEQQVLSNTYKVITNPYVYLRCITPGYSGFPENDTSFTIPPPPYTNIGYTISQYLTTIQSNMTNLMWGLTGFAKLNDPDKTFQMGINIKHIIPNISPNGQSNFTIDFSKSVLAQMSNSPSMWIIDSSNSVHTFDNLVFSSSYSVIKGVNDQIQIIVKGQSQGYGGAYYFPMNSNSFVTYFYISPGEYSLQGLFDQINKQVFALDQFSDSSYNIHGTNQYISNGRVNMYGSYMSHVENPTDITQNKIVFNLSIRSILTHNDYHLEFYDPTYYTQNPSFGPGLLNQVSYSARNPPVDHQFRYNVFDTSVNYVNSYTILGSNLLSTPYNNGTWNNLENSWYNYLYISDPSYLLIKQPVVILNTQPGVPYVCINGTTTITDQQLWLTSNNNYLMIKPAKNTVDVSGGGVFVANPSEYNGIYSYANDIKITLDLPLYTFYHSDEIVNEFNKQFTMNPITYGSYMYIDKASHHTVIRLNMNKIFTAQDYSIVFYESNLFTRCSYGSHPSIQTTTRDTTLGWLLGFRNLPIYNLNSEWVRKYNSGHNTSVINYTCDSNNIVSIVGDTSVSITLYNYFLIILDDYTQNHLNDGLVTVNSPALDISLPSYANRNTYRCNLAFSQNNHINPNDTTYIGNSRDPTTNNNLTLKQLYSANQILNTQQNNTQTYQTNMGIYVQDIFGIIPIKTSGLINGQTYVEFGGTLQNQDRTYFGPVNIKRMAVRILTDKGNILDLNNANISFSLIAQQLYNPYARG